MSFASATMVANRAELGVTETLDEALLIVSA
jgi:hypothetical protein